MELGAHAIGPQALSQMAEAPNARAVLPASYDTTSPTNAVSPTPAGRFPLPSDPAAELAALALPHSYYLSGAARARLEVFQRRGVLTRELTALGLPPVYEHRTGVLVGKQVATADDDGDVQPPPAAPQEPRRGGRAANRPASPSPTRNKNTPDWRDRRQQQATNPARNPIMTHNLKMKSQLAQQAARVAGKGVVSSARIIRYNAALDEAARTITKPHVLSGTERHRLGSAPVAKPYYPRKVRGGVPCNEEEGGNLMPGRIARRVSELQEEQLQGAEGSHAGGGRGEAERRRQARIQQLADVIVAAPELGIHELGSYLPQELHPPTSHATSEGSAGSHTATGPSAPSLSNKLPPPGPPRGPSASSIPTTDRPLPMPVRPHSLLKAPDGTPDAAAATPDAAATSPPPHMAAAAPSPLGDGWPPSLIPQLAPTTEPTDELSEALRQLDLAAEAAHSVIADVEEDYGARLVAAAAAAAAAALRGGKTAAAAAGGRHEQHDRDDGGSHGDGGISSAASSYGSGGGHYLYEEGMAEEEGEGFVLSSGEEGSEGGATAAGGKGGGGVVDGSQPTAVGYPDKVVSEMNAVTGLAATRYPALDPERRHAARQGKRAEGGQQPARERLKQEVSLSMPYNPETVRHWDTHLPGEAAGGRRIRNSGADVSAMPTAAEATVPVPTEPPDSAQQPWILAGPAVPPTAVTTAAAAAAVATVTQGEGTAGQPLTTAADISTPPPPPAQQTSLLEHADPALLSGAAVAAGQQGTGEVASLSPDVTASDVLRDKEGGFGRAVSAAPGAHTAPPLRVAVRAAAGRQQILHADVAAAAAPVSAAAGIAVNRPPEVGAPIDGRDPALERFGLSSDEDEEGGDEDGAQVEGSGLDGEAENGSQVTGGGGGGAAMQERQQEQRRGSGGGGGDGQTPYGGTARVLDSSSDEDDPWGVVDVDSLGYPLGFQQAASHDPLPSAAPPGSPTPQDAAGATAPVPAAVPSDAISDSSSRGSWGITSRDKQVVQQTPSSTAGHHLPLHQRSNPGSSGRSPTAAVAAAARRGSQRSDGHPPPRAPRPVGRRDIRELLGLRTSDTTASVVDPSDIPALHLTPPPEWLVGLDRIGGLRRQDNNNVQQGNAARGQMDPQGGDKRSPPLPRGQELVQQQVHQPPPPMGRVEAALARAQTRKPVAAVRHDDNTFYFSEPR